LANSFELPGAKSIRMTSGYGFGVGAADD